MLDSGPAEIHPGRRDRHLYHMMRRPSAITVETSHCCCAGPTALQKGRAACTGSPSCCSSSNRCSGSSSEGKPPPVADTASKKPFTSPTFVNWNIGRSIVVLPVTQCIAHIAAVPGAKDSTMSPASCRLLSSQASSGAALWMHPIAAFRPPDGRDAARRCLRRDGFAHEQATSKV